MKWLRAVLVVIAGGIMISLLIIADFVYRSTPSIISASQSDPVVVFTGHDDRVVAGLAMLEREQVAVLFISGANRPSGVHPEAFARHFTLSPDLRDALAEGRIILATDAMTTLENAVETACWLAQTRRRRVVLVTDRFHMARASLALERAAPWPIQVVRIFPEQLLQKPDPPLSWLEGSKFATLWGLTLLPRWLWPIDRPAIC